MYNGRGEMGRVLAVANQKGGVAKTTTVAALCAALTERGHTALAVDLDPQASLTYTAGFEPDDVQPTVHDVLVGRCDLESTILEVDEGFDLVPANIDLAGADAYLLARTGREYALRQILEAVAGRYESLSHRGVGQLLATIEDVRRLTNRGLEVLGLLPTMYDGRTRHAREVLDAVGERYGLPVLDPIPRSIRFAEAPAAGRSILGFAPRHPGADAYRVLSESLVA